MVALTSLGFIDKLALLVKMEKTRFKKKGLFSTILGYSLLFSLIYVSREVGLRVWPENIENKFLFFFIGAVLLHYLA